MCCVIGLQLCAISEMDDGKCQVQGNMKQSVWCESQYNERATNDGNRTEVHRPDS